MTPKISRRSFLKAAGITAFAAASGLTGCGKAAVSSSASSSQPSAAQPHEPLTILTARRDYTTFLELLHTSYPEINVQFEPYHGQNTSAYMLKQLESGCVPDIYTSTYAWDGSLQAEHLIDLSQYSVTDRYSPVQMEQTDVDGATYLLPYDFTIHCLGYNKTLFEHHDWAVPGSFAELQALIPQIRAAGVVPAACQFDLPGFGFQYFCNVADTVFLNTLEGRQWQQDFLAGNATASEGLAGCADLFQQWIDAGLVNMDSPNYASPQANELFRGGNSAFFLGSLNRYTQNADGTGDQYGILPYLSPDGTTNTYILQVSHYYGLSKQLEQPGNEQKLEDALHFLEVLSTPEGYACIAGENSLLLCALNDFTPPEGSPYRSALAEINNGHLAPFLYAGWEDQSVNFGNAVRSWVNGKITGAEALAVMDATQQQVLASGSVTYGEVTEALDTPQTAQLTGQMYLAQTDADAALISYNVWKPGVSPLYENIAGVNGRLLPGGLTEANLVSFLPTGWYDCIPTVLLTGAQLKQLAAYGYDQNRNDDPYPYLLLTRSGRVPEDDVLYRVAYAGLDSTVRSESSPQSTNVVGLDAAKEYFSALGTISSAALDDHLLISNF